MPTKRSRSITTTKRTSSELTYTSVLSEMVDLLEQSRHTAARAVNTIMTATYWEVGRRIVELEQGGKKKADYGEQLIDQLADDLTGRFGRGFGRRNLFQMRAFYLTYADIVQTTSAQFDLAALSRQFPLSWSHYVSLLSAKTSEAREFYEAEALRGGWSIRQLKRQMNSMFYERTLLSKN